MNDSRENRLSVWVLLWTVELDRKVGALSLRLQPALSGRVCWRKDCPGEGIVAWKGERYQIERRLNQRRLPNMQIRTEMNSLTFMEI